jgi:hypothetical protein
MFHPEALTEKSFGFEDDDHILVYTGNRACLLQAGYLVNPAYAKVSAGTAGNRAGKRAGGREMVIHASLSCRSRQRREGKGRVQKGHAYGETRTSRSNLDPQPAWFILNRMTGSLFCRCSYSPGDTWQSLKL